MQRLEVNQMLASNYVTKRQNLFQLEFDGIDAFVVRTADRPKFNFDEIERGYLNSKIYEHGRLTWDAISCTMHDPITPSAAQKLMEWVRLGHESVFGRDGYPSFYKKDGKLKALDQNGNVVEQWDIRGAWVQAGDFGSYDQNSSDPIEINFTLRADQFILRF